MKKILTVGVFDFFHYGHLQLFKKMRKYGNYIIVAVQEDNSIHQTKPNTDIFYSTQQRVEMIESLRIVDCVITYKNVDAFVPTVDFDVFAVGEFQNHYGFQRAIKWCENHGKEVVRIERTPDISSSKIKALISL